MTLEEKRRAIAAIHAEIRKLQAEGWTKADFDRELELATDYVRPTARERGDWNEAASDYHRRGLHSLGRLMQDAADASCLPAERYYLVRRDFVSWDNARLCTCGRSGGPHSVQSCQEKPT